MTTKDINALTTVCFVHVPTICSIFLVLLGLCGALLAGIGSYSCSFFEVDNGSLGNLPFSGTAGLMRYANGTDDCQSYTDFVIEDDVDFQIAAVSAWGAPVAALMGVALGLVQALVMSGCCLFIMASYGTAFMFLCLSFVLRQTSVCAGECSVSTGAFCMLAAMVFVFFPGMLIICTPSPQGLVRRKITHKIEDVVAGDVEGEAPEDKKRRKNQNEMKFIRMALGDPSAAVM